MKKVGIITFLHNGNYGSTLQAYALQRVIREMGYDCEHIDYQPDLSEKIRNLISSGNHWKLVLDGLKKRRVAAGQAGARVKLEAIPDFYARRMQLSPVCRNSGELKKQGARYDILVCGSDQIWNPVWLNPAYFLNFAAAEQPRIAYAASLGVRELAHPKKEKVIRRLTEGFQAISVREEEGAELLGRITGEKPAVMLDPVCLLTAEEWSGVAGEAPQGDPYLLCYYIGENPEYWEKVQKLKEETGLRTLVLPVTAESYGAGYELLDGAGPEDFLGAVKHAALFCTDSFHGLAFGTLFGTRTELVRRYREDDPESKNSRVDHFLRQIREKGLERLRREGLAWLREQLEQ